MTMPARGPGEPRIIARPDARAIRKEVLRGLHDEPKTLPPKLFYDAVGARLFEEICELPEYYLTRAELEILRARAGEIAALAGPRVALLEYGSGAGVKIRLLLDALESPAAYVPIDISREQLARVSRELAAEYPGVAVRPLNADYTMPLAARRFLPRLDDRQLPSHGSRGLPRPRPPCGRQGRRPDPRRRQAQARGNAQRRVRRRRGGYRRVQQEHPDAPQSRCGRALRCRQLRASRILQCAAEPSRDAPREQGRADREGRRRAHPLRARRVDLDGELVQVRPRASRGAHRDRC